MRRSPVGPPLILFLLFVACPCRAVTDNEVGGVGDSRRGEGAIGLTVGIPQLVAAQWDIPVARSFDLSLHAGTILWAGSLGARLRWRSAEPGLHPYVYAGGYLVAILLLSETDHDSAGGPWAGGGLEWRGEKWKCMGEIGSASDSNDESNFSICFAVGVARLY